MDLPEDGTTPQNDASAEPAVPRKRGSRTRQLVIEAATSEFLEKGFVGARIVSIAKRAGCSTKTIYRMVPDKLELFRIVADARIALYLTRLEEGAPQQIRDSQALFELTRALAVIVLSEETYRTVKLILLEQESFPAAAESYGRAVDSMSRIFDDRFMELVKAGILNWPNPEEAAGMLRLLIAGAQKQILLGIQAPLGEDEARAFADRCTRLLLRGAPGL